MISGHEIYKKTWELLLLPLVVLLSFGSAVTALAKESTSDKDKPHMVVIPAELGEGPFEPIRWNKANKNGVHIVLLSGNKDSDLLVLVQKNGTLIKNLDTYFSSSISFPLLDDKVEFMWLNDSFFAVTESRAKKSSYTIYHIARDVEYCSEEPPLVDGTIEGRAQFSFKKGIFRVTQGKKTMITIPWKKIEPHV